MNRHSVAVNLLFFLSLSWSTKRYRNHCSISYSNLLFQKCIQIRVDDSYFLVKKRFLIQNDSLHWNKILTIISGCQDNIIESWRLSYQFEWSKCCFIRMISKIVVYLMKFNWYIYCYCILLHNTIRWWVKKDKINSECIIEFSNSIASIFCVIGSVFFFFWWMWHL